MTAVRLRGDVHLNVRYDDHTVAGSPVSNRPQELVREVFDIVVAALQDHPNAGVLARSPDLLAKVVSEPTFATWVDLERRHGRVVGWTVHDDLLHPDPRLAPPRWLTVASTDRNLLARAQLTPAHWPAMHQALSALDADGIDPADIDDPDVRAFVRGLVEHGLASPDVACTEPPGELQGPGVTFLGHNTVAVRTATTQVVIDPMLFAQKQSYPAHYRPLARRHLGRVDAILITHSHPDHFDPASLLRFDPDVMVIIPEVARETVLTVDVGRRLDELGFTNLVPLAWNDTVLVGDVAVTALPFFGEQPTDDEVLHPEVRNEGNTYQVTTPDQQLIFLADAGVEGAASMFDVARDHRRREDRPDAIFVGYRGWITYAAQLLLSSVARYLWFVPPDLWGARMQLMLDPSSAVDLAERFGAPVIVPYADGGAPWHWDIGLGPRLDGHGHERQGFDLFPERVETECQRRVELLDGSSAGSRVRPVLLRPGDTVTTFTPPPEPRRVSGHGWPYGP